MENIVESRSHHKHNGILVQVILYMKISLHIADVHLDVIGCATCEFVCALCVSSYVCVCVCHHRQANGSLPHRLITSLFVICRGIHCCTVACIVRMAQKISAPNNRMQRRNNVTVCSPFRTDSTCRHLASHFVRPAPPSIRFPSPIPMRRNGSSDVSAVYLHGTPHIHNNSYRCIAMASGDARDL